jgi:nucleoside-diphosphate-sugar epimerase
MIKRVLVTGAGGFVGRHCLPFLVDAGFEVHAVSRGQHEDAPSIHWHALNLLDDGNSQRIIKEVQPTHLLHMAWYAEPGRYWMAPENYQWVRASLALLDAFATHGGRRVVTAGTCAEYDWHYGWCSEEVTPTTPATVYGVCKHSLCNMQEAFCREFGISSAWGRIFFLYGPHEHPSRLVSSVIRALIRKEPALCTSGEQIRDFLHVRDVASAFVAVLDSGVEGSLNIASGNSVRIREVVALIGQKLGSSDLLRLGARASAVSDPPVLLADVRRLSEVLGWRPAIGLEEGIEEAITWWRGRPGCE